MCFKRQDFDIRVKRRIGDRLIEAEISADQGLTALFAPSGAGKTSVLNTVPRPMQQSNTFAPFYLDCPFGVDSEDLFLSVFPHHSNIP